MNCYLRWLKKTGEFCFATQLFTTVLKSKLLWYGTFPGNRERLRISNDNKPLTSLYFIVKTSAHIIDQLSTFLPKYASLHPRRLEKVERNMNLDFIFIFLF